MATGSNNIWDNLDSQMYGTTVPKQKASKITTPKAPQPRASVPSQPTGFGSYLGGGVSNASKIDPTDPRLAQLELDKTSMTAVQRILNDPVAMRGKTTDQLVEDLEKIAAGQKLSKSGLFDSIGSAVLGGLETLGYVLDRPLAAVTSLAKEISDIPSAQASPVDLFKQALAKDTRPSKYIAKTGTKWLDQTIGFAADVVLDPLTYVNFGASKWSGREGRLNLAAFAAKEENIARAPTLLPKINDGSIGRLGEWALDANERKVLGMQRGLSFSFGSGRTIGKEGTLGGKVSSGLATAGGKTFAKGRATLSDTGLFTPLQKLTAKQAEKVAGLTLYGRRAGDSPEVTNRVFQLARYNAAMKSNAGGRVLGTRLARDGSILSKDLLEHEQRTGLNIYGVLEGTRGAVDDVEQALADRTRTFLDSTANTVNETTSEFGVRRGTSPFLIERRANYVPHVFSKEAQDFLASKRFKDSPWSSSLRKSLGMGVEEFTQGPGIMMERKLKTGERFLGRKLESNTGEGFASMDEINKISQDVLGVKIFDDNGASIVDNYIKSAVNQVKRVTFVDTLFDYGTDVVRAVSPKVIDNKIVGDQWLKTLGSYDSIVNPILDDLVGRTQGVLGPRLALAESIISSAPGARILNENQLNGVRTVLRQTMDFLNQSDNAARNLDDATREAYDTVAAPLRARLNFIENSIAAGDEIALIKELGLTDLYRRLYPDAGVLPDAKSMAEDIVDGVQELLGDDYSGQAIKALEKAISGAEGNVENSARLAVDRLKSELESLKATSPQSTSKISNAEKRLAAASEQLSAEDAIGLTKEQWDNSVGAVYSSDIRNVIESVSANPPAGAAGESTAQWIRKTQQTLDGLDSPGLALTEIERTVLKNVLTQLKGMESQIALLEAQRGIPERVLNQAITEGNIGDVADKILKGWENIESLGVTMPPEVRDLLFGKMEELKTAAGSNKFWKMYQGYNKFFKVSALLSPGSILRNGYTAAFNNFVAGVSVKETIDGLRFATNVMRNGLDAALEKVPAKLRTRYEEAVRVAYATGAGQTADDILSPIISSKAKKIVQGKIVGTWSQANVSMELAARFSLALSQLNRGANFEDAVGNVARYHFDYGNLSTLDEAMLKFIPFWTFASRNVPLQIINQAARPKMYRIWESAQTNFPAEDESSMPMWLRERQPLQLPFLPKGTLVNLDLPQIDMGDQARMLTDPRRLLSQANPLVKLPIELLGNEQLWSGQPFSERPSQIRGPLDFPAYAAGMIFGGSGKKPSTGEYYTSSKAEYAVPNLLPTLAQLQRLVPELGGKESYQDRAGSSRAAFFGLPFRRVAEGEQFNELTRRQFAIRDYLSNLTRSGQIMPKQ